MSNNLRQKSLETLKELKTNGSFLSKEMRAFADYCSSQIKNELVEINAKIKIALEINTIEKIQKEFEDQI